MEEEQGEGQNQNAQSILPAYEEVKRNILICWVKIQNEYEEYLRINSKGANYPLFDLSAKLISLYQTMLRQKFLKDKDFEDFVATMDQYVKDGMIDTNELNETISQFSRWMEKGGITNIGFENKPYQQRFREGYGV